MSGSGKMNVQQTFAERRKRQVYAVIVTVVLMFSALWKMKHPGLFLGTISEDTVSWFIIGLIVVFMAFSSFNWKCPACGKYLGSNIAQKRCRKCGTPFI